MDDYSHVLLIVPAALVQQYRTLTAALSGTVGMGAAAFSATGEAPATHYVDHGHVLNQFLPIMEVDTPPAERTGAMLAAASGMPIASAKALLDACDISRDEGLSKINARGLYACDRIDINGASRTALASAPGVGSVKAQSIIDGRPWASVAAMLVAQGLAATPLIHWYTA